jgi:hypothetical protein
MNGFARPGASTHRARCGVGVFACVFASALSAAPPGNPPTAGAVLDRYVKVTGGAAAWRAKRSERDEIEGRTLDAERVVLRATVTLSRMGDSLSNIEVPQKASEGIYKGIAWALSDFSGVRIKNGMEREEALRDSRMLEEADWRALYPKSRLAGIETIAGQRCYKVLLLPSPIEKVEWFSVASGLLVQRASSEISPSGDTPAGYTVEQWATHDGIKQPSVMQAWRGDFQYRLTILNTTFNTHTQREDFAYPAEYVAADRAGKALPNAEEIVERHIFESGGPEAYEMLRAPSRSPAPSPSSRATSRRAPQPGLPAEAAITNRLTFPAWANRKKAATAESPGTVPPPSARASSPARGIQARSVLRSMRPV